jgi:hypothetical protein
MNGKNQVGKGSLPRRALLAIALAAINFGALAQQLEEDHREFEATLYAPYAGDTQGSRSFTLDFSYPFVESAQDIFWRLELLDARGNTVQRWQGIERLTGAPRKVNIDWAARGADPSLADGVYTVRMVATARPTTDTGGDTSAEGVDAVLAAADDAEEQKWDIVVGAPSVAAMPSAATVAAPLPKPSASTRLRSAVAVAAAPAQPAYTIYFGNLHSQTNHSDGGAALDACHSAQPPQSARFGPRDAYAYARGRGLDFLMTSEHNHMFDGSAGTNPDADPLTARARFHAGLAEGFGFSAGHPGFVALYGQEWGVIANGGHLNILDATELLGWEAGKNSELVADTFTARGDYAGLYALMHARGWTGQFNHPAMAGQFLVNGVALGYTPDGDAAMALCEVVNTNAFSSNDTETETRRTIFEGACNKALEAGYHVAFSSNQDNHCANWGAAYTNRTGVLLARGQPFTHAAFLDAVRARRVFATMDKTAQLVLMANGHVMGERFTNKGALALRAHFSSSTGRKAASVKLMEGVPGRNGTVSVLSELADVTVVPAPGAHFYYARVTQDDGNILWSAPVWVTQIQ